VTETENFQNGSLGLFLDCKVQSGSTKRQTCFIKYCGPSSHMASSWTLNMLIQW